MSASNAAPRRAADERSHALSVERRKDVAIVWFDIPGEPVNTLRAGFEKELGRALEEIRRAPGVRAAVIASAKRTSFVTGADVAMLEKVRTATEAAELARTAQRAMGEIERFPIPIVAAIHGACLGGGLELALACAGRVASSSPSTELGQPEVQLGLIPGAGGTQRLPRTIGLESSLDRILTGKSIDARKARRLGLVDEVVHEAIVVDAAIDRAHELAEAERRGDGLFARVREIAGNPLDGDSWRRLLLEDNPFGRKVLFDQASKRVEKETGGHYPAPPAALRVIRTGAGRGFEAGLAAEAEAFGELCVSPEARSLMSLFFARNALAKDPGTEDRSVRPREARKVGVLGAGLMGSGIATISARNAGATVRLRDKDHEALGRGLRAIRGSLDERVRKRRMTPHERDEVLARVRPTLGWTGFGNADLVIEAVFENLDLKRRMLREVEENAAESTIFATNTSSIPLSEITAECRRPENVVGMHYFSPAEKMPLLEVVTTEKTSPEVVATAVAFGKRQGKTVIVVRDGAGFYTSRILGAYLNEAAHLVAEGVPVERVDRALERFGFPVGPLRLLEEVGVDVGVEVSEVLERAFGERMAPPRVLARVADDDRKGKKNGRGFYRFEKKKGGYERVDREVDPSIYELLGVEPENDLDDEEIALRCALQMTNEAARCHGEGILRSAGDGDVGAVFGLGFPPFRGGPFRDVDARGAAEVVRRIEAWRDGARGGPRWEPAPVLVELARTGKSFHGDSAPETGTNRG